MTLTCTTTGRRTNMVDADDTRSLQSAADRLVRRTHPGHYADLNFGGSRSRLLDHVEIVRSVGSMTEHTGEFVDFAIS